MLLFHLCTQEKGSTAVKPTRELAKPVVSRKLLYWKRIPFWSPSSTWWQDRISVWGHWSSAWSKPNSRPKTWWIRLSKTTRHSIPRLWSLCIEPRLEMNRCRPFHKSIPLKIMLQQKVNSRLCQRSSMANKFKSTVWSAMCHRMARKSQVGWILRKKNCRNTANKWKTLSVSRSL